MSIKGIDVSVFQGTIDWEKVKAAGYQFAMIRAGYGYSTVDPQFHRNASECNRIGLPIGVYWFCYALTPEDAAREAQGCMNAISGYRLDYPVCYDIEQASVDYAAGQGVTVTPALARQLVESFCNTVENNGYFAMFYTNRYFLDTYLGSALTERYAYWYARYTGTFDGTNCGIWQYSSTGSVPGISGNVDLDEGFVDYPSVIRTAGLNHLNGSSPAPSPEPSPSPAPDYITYVIQPGDTLSGIAQRYGTTVSALSSLNGISNPDLIYAGNTIRIPESGNSGRYYTIKSGDTLSGIAAQFGTTVSALAALNGISDPDRIYAGNTIRIS
ncbi:LysM peptidoglycan-binding domain-containing protein [Ruminococcus sp. CLA-AA-H200]|uniref:LysM peptidoglycan-binding domain-containing protein n=1 Tax=Ruminococcus turbiniformis TaxID=2881258 RepID=A0ABS8FYH8_9FIRM|nr:LysM peptidoglycan-binding domain-containing protein [Ruminococcus turbiniformis]MCC2254227.1 LysM peptidoglycan-binding domain-containing protein [Ruminococcus turbiniformis]